MIIDRFNVNEIVKKSGLTPDKDYGQNYLIDQTLASRIVDEIKASKSDHILEIGPGLGSLTHFLSLTNAKITAVDIDSRMINFLKVVYADNSNVSFIENDIRKVDLKDYSKIIGNLPYNITTEVISYALINGLVCQKMIFMCQSEAFPRFSDLSGKDYGPVSILIHLLGYSRKLFVVKPGSFYPSPKCSSTVFEIIINEDADREQCIEVYQLSKQLFLNRRKTILNNLTIFLKEKALANKVCKDCSIPENSRPEQISPKDFLAIYKVIKENGKL